MSRKHPAAGTTPYRRMLNGLRAKRRRGPKEWSVYVVQCGDGSLYTGIAKDVRKRVAAHESGKGAAYTRTRRPLILRYEEPGLTRSGALVREAEIKSWPRNRKLRLWDGYGVSGS